MKIKLALLLSLFCGQIHPGLGGFVRSFVSGFLTSNTDNVKIAFQPEVRVNLYCNKNLETRMRYHVKRYDIPAYKRIIFK